MNDGVVGWDDPEAVQEYRQRVGVAQAGAKVPWEVRRDYLVKLAVLKELVTREMDRAQEGKPANEELLATVAEFDGDWNAYVAAAGSDRG